MTSSMRWVVAGIVAVVALVTMVAVVVYPSATHVSWDEANASLDAFPVPNGYRVTDRSQRGARCFISPSCEDPKVSITLSANDPRSRMSCGDLRTLTDQWHGFRTQDIPKGAYPTNDCVIEGEVGKFPVQTFFVDPHGDDMIVTLFPKS